MQTAKQTPRSIYFRSLGCPKNQLDSEVMLGKLVLAEFSVAARIEDAQIAIVNTCSFIESAREESIEAILEVAELRETGQLEALIVTGCLPQRYGAELSRELPEVDAFIGTNRFQEIPQILDEVLAGGSRGVYVEQGQSFLYDADTPRLLIGSAHSAYVKLSEGCDRICSFCAIPSIRGKFHSRPPESIRAEAEQLAAGATKEICLIAQDSTAYGKDLPGRPSLAELLRELDDVKDLAWIRQLYLYPTAITDELIEVLGTSARVLPYVDVPLQHASDRILKTMRRGATAAIQGRLIDRLRAMIPNLTLRTTLIVGFPGETEADFEELCAFVRESRFDRLGAFRYSDEDGTAAKDLPDKVPAKVARERYRRILDIQQEIMENELRKLVGSEQTVLIDRARGGRATGRMGSQAPEIDGVVHLQGLAEVGELRRARITGVRELDLEADLLDCTR